MLYHRISSDCRWVVVLPPLCAPLGVPGREMAQAPAAAASDSLLKSPASHPNRSSAWPSLQNASMPPDSLRSAAL
jgi:hypothetical protein